MTGSQDDIKPLPFAFSEPCDFKHTHTQDYVMCMSVGCPRQPTNLNAPQGNSTRSLPAPPHPYHLHPSTQSVFLTGGSVFFRRSRKINVGSTV